MKALTIRQPWAWAIGRLKEFETLVCRAPEDAIGRWVAVHAADRQVDPWDWTRLHRGTMYFAPGLFFPKVDEFSLGAVVSVGRLTECSEVTPALLKSQGPLEREWGEWAVGRFVWRLREVRILPEPVEVPGQEGLWKLPMAVEGSVRAALAER